jgi:hypothetical protein
MFLLSVVRRFVLYHRMCRDFLPPFVMSDIMQYLEHQQDFHFDVITMINHCQVMAIPPPNDVIVTIGSQVMIHL